MHKEWSLWQIIDSAFPSGAFVHSGGLEAAVQHGIVRDAATLDQFVRAAIRQMQAGVLKFIDAAWQDPAGFSQIDADCDLFLNNAVTNRASRAQGRAFLATAQRVFPNVVVRLEAKGLGHLAPIFGAACRDLDIERPKTTSVFLFTTARGYFSSAVRLGIVGPIEAQQIQRSLSQAMQPASGDDVPVQTSPVLDLIQGTQDRLYSRLFQS